MKRAKNKTLKTLCALILLFASVFLLSCSMIRGYSEPEDQLVVSLMGFDIEDGDVRVSLAIAADGERGGERRVSGIGKTVEDALSTIAAAESKTLDGAHLAVIVLGRGVDNEKLLEIARFCKENVDISVAVRLVSATDAKGLIEGFSGYGLLGMLTEGDGAPFSSESRLYTVLSALDSNDKYVSIPHFSEVDGGFGLYGIRVCGGGGSVVLDRSEGATYMMMRGSYKQGKGFSSGLSGSDHPSFARTEYRFEETDGGGVLWVVCEVAGGSAELTQSRMKGLYAELSGRYGDIFGFVERARAKGFSGNSLSELTVKFECVERGE